MPRPNHTCPDCGRRVLKVITAAGRAQLLDPDQNPKGNVALYQDGPGTWRARVPTEDYPALPYEHIHMPHPATCNKGPRRPPIPPAPAIDRTSPTQASSVRSLADYRRTRTPR